MKKGYEFSERKNKKYRQRVKESIATATAANLVTEQNDDSDFSQAHIRSRSIQEVAETVQKSPRKRKEVILALARKFKLRINSAQSKAEGPKNELTEGEKEWLKSFLDKSDITYVTPDRNYVGKVDGKSQYVQKRYLIWTLNDPLNIANGIFLIKSESSFEFPSGKKNKNFISCTNTLKAIRNMYKTETFHSHPAFEKYAKMSVSLQKL